MKFTCGIFLINAEGKLLLVHPTNSKENYWSIPKGLMEQGETPWESAKRELQEETSLILHDNYILAKTPNDPQKYPRIPKTLLSFTVIVNFGSIEGFRCNSMVEIQGMSPFPENDKIKWFSMEELDSIELHSTQMAFLPQIKTICALPHQ